MSASTVHVTGIASQTTDKEVQDFFSFCGKITSISVTPTSAEEGASKSATVTFEKDTAAKTALLLDNTQLGPASVQVTSAHSLDEIAGEKSTAAATETTTKDEQGNTIEQEDKPRSRIFAEYLAHGYVISDQAIQRAIALDQKHGFSNRFTSALSNFDSKYHATDKAKGLDTSYGISDKAVTGWKGLNSYFEKALDTPTGRKVRDFYIQSEKQVQDIHNEARRLADLKKQSSPEAGAATTAEAQGVAGAGVAPSGVPTGEPEKA